MRMRRSSFLDRIHSEDLRLGYSLCEVKKGEENEGINDGPESYLQSSELWDLYLTL